MKKETETKSKKSSSKAADSKTGGDERVRFVIGLLLTGFALYLLVAVIAYLIWWKTDQSLSPGQVISGADVTVKNWSGKSGAWLAYIIVYKGFGLASLLIPVMVGSLGLYLLNLKKIRLLSLTAKLAIGVILLSILLGYIFSDANGYLGAGPGGAHGFLVSRWLNAFLGKAGNGILMLLLTIGYMIFALRFSPSFFKIPTKNRDHAITGSSTDDEETSPVEDPLTDEKTDHSSVIADFPISNTLSQETDFDFETEKPTSVSGSIIKDLSSAQHIEEEDELPMDVVKAASGEMMSESELESLRVNYDPKLDLPRYQIPPISLLKDHKSAGQYDTSEVVANKETIIKALGDHKIAIKHISATVGPTVTLYELVPERGVRLARIKSLENDIALNLSALGIRIIAPIPGRGTVGIEVPNKKPETVSMKSLIASKAFQESKFDLPLAVGRTITNEPYIVDLTRMPHLLVAGATGQGKSVGLNAIITSILYKKHPSELKFVLIDPKRVELPLYAKIERHFLAKLPGEEDAIITDTQKVIKTLNSLCIEMDGRLELLKNAQVRAIKEYNEKFMARKLNPNKGHRYMPYIVLIIDEFADLIMTAGREIEGPIGRLAQLARAIGIHLIISTQRPSANIITGFIKANFPTRIAFRVFSSVDSRTILDSNGADKLVGRGDMLVSSGSEPVRVQCAFIDTPEIEDLTEYIGGQQGYPSATILPEVGDDSASGVSEIDLKKRDDMFEEAARLVVQHQQGSTSLIQRKLSIGYNRAGRIIDQLEAAGIVGPFEGSKARDVMITDPVSLEQILSRLE